MCCHAAESLVVPSTKDIDKRRGATTLRATVKWTIRASNADPVLFAKRIVFNQTLTTTPNCIFSTPQSSLLLI